MTTRTELPEWLSLKNAQHEQRKISLRTLFTENPNRFSEFSRELDGFLLDFSKTHLHKETLDSLINLAKACEVEEKLQSLMRGDIVNITEKRAALHTALRRSVDNPLYLHEKNIMTDIGQTLEKMHDFCSKIQSGIRRGYTGEKFTDIVNIGVGGSELGPQFIIDALRPSHFPHLKVHFVSNLDPHHLNDVLKHCHPKSTLFIVSSKSFRTQETLANFHLAKTWLNHGFQSSHAFHLHFVAVTENSTAALAEGFGADDIFPIWDFVGGRYSLWSAIGLSIGLAIGMDQFEKLLAGARAMDEHVLNTSLENNLPVLHALIGIWYNNFFASSAQAIIPYSHLLRYLPQYLQQAEMESNGKQVSLSGKTVAYNTAPIIWGAEGSNSQHSFHQLLHQSHHLIPVDFIASAKTDHAHHEEHKQLLANALAQARALAFGQTEAEIYENLLAQGVPVQHAKMQAIHRTCPGNKPSTMIVLPEINAYYLGMLLAFYEHKIFVQSVIWNINPFDQFGVEYGKILAQEIVPIFENTESLNHMDSSTLGAISHFKKFF